MTAQNPTITERPAARPDWIIVADLHIGSPWESARRQDWVLDYIRRRDPLSGVILAGDSFEKLTGRRGLRGHPRGDRLRRLAESMPTIAIPGNFPHDSREWLNEIRDLIAPISILPADLVSPLGEGLLLDMGVDGGGTHRRLLITHGAQWDPRLRYWRWLRPLSAYLPTLTRHLIGRLPSELVHEGRWSAAQRAHGRIASAAIRAADAAGLSIIMGHTHLSAAVETPAKNMVYDLGSAGMDNGAARLAEIRHAGDYRRITLTTIPREKHIHIPES